MDVEDDDDFYGEETAAPESAEESIKVEEAPKPEVKNEDEDLEEGEEEDEADSDDSDIDIITERKPAPEGQKYNQAPPARTTIDSPTKPAVTKKETPPKPPPSASLPGISISKIDVNAKPVYEPAGKPITQVNIDEDLPDNDKPWRKPGADVSDYFNYGFDEFTWALYASKQDTLRSEFDPEQMKNMMMMSMPGLGGLTGAGAGMEGIPPEMQQMMQQMMAQGMDPSQMDPSMFAGMQGGTGVQGGQGQGFGGNPGFAGYGGGNYDQGNQGGGRGNYGRGRGGRGRW